MKKMCCVLLFSLICCSRGLYAQQIDTKKIDAQQIDAQKIDAQKIDMPMDSVKSLLCGKWTPVYTLFGNTRRDTQPGEVLINFEFKKDHTLVYTGSRPGQVGGHGTWVYDPKKKIIPLSVDNNPMSSVVSITKNQMVMQIQMVGDEPGQKLIMKMVYKRMDK